MAEILVQDALTAGLSQQASTVPPQISAEWLRTTGVPLGQVVPGEFEALLLTTCGQNGSDYLFQRTEDGLYTVTRPERTTAVQRPALPISMLPIEGCEVRLETAPITIGTSLVLQGLNRATKRYTPGLNFMLDVVHSGYFK